MTILFQVASAAAVLLHVLFFAEESLLWMKPAIYQKTFGFTLEEAQVTRVLAYNQGFYNLFLAAGALFGQAAPALLGVSPSAARAVSTFALLSMLGAALVLLSSKRSFWLGALLQGGPAALALLALWRGA